MTRTAPLPFLALAAAGLALAGCGADDGNQTAAEALEEAAEQSTPAAADVLESAAEGMREGEPGAPDSAQEALRAAGNAQVEAIRPPAPQPVPPQQQAKPHEEGDPVPPPKVDADAAGQADHTGHEGQ